MRDLLTKRAGTSRLLARLTRLFSKSRRHQPLLTSAQTAPPAESSFREGQRLDLEAFVFAVPLSSPCEAMRSLLDDEYPSQQISIVTDGVHFAAC